MICQQKTNTLSQLSKGEIFKFKGGQEALYVVNNGHPQVLETNDYTEYEVIKKNETSVRARVVCGSAEYIFKFKGLFSGGIKGGVDSDIKIVQ